MLKRKWYYTITFNLFILKYRLSGTIIFDIYDDDITQRIETEILKYLNIEIKHVLLKLFNFKFNSLIVHDTIFIKDDIIIPDAEAGKITESWQEQKCRNQIPLQEGKKCMG